MRGPQAGTRGSGLGLSIVRAVAESHGGTVTLEPPNGGTGARFVITIPRDPPIATGDPLTTGDRPRTPARVGRRS